MRLARYFGTSPQYWLNLQIAYDLEVAGEKIQPKIEKEVQPPTASIRPGLAFREGLSSASNRSLGALDPSGDSFNATF